MAWPKNPVVYEINTAVWLSDLTSQHGNRITLGEVSQASLEAIAADGFDAVWLMGVWERSPRAREIARTHPDLQHAYAEALPDYTTSDVIGSPYAILRYEVDPILGGPGGLAAFRQRLRRLGIRLVLDFVPNHLATDHAWLAAHPGRFVQADEARLQNDPGNYFRHEAEGVMRVYAHGRDPNYSGWTDTAQLDYRCAETRRAMSEVLMSVAGQCDGVRCDMAMLMTSDVFVRTWGGAYDEPDTEFWPDAIGSVKLRYPEFLMLAEVYLDLEFRLQQLGFDYTYDKRLYDRLMGHDAVDLRAHLRASLDYQERLMRFTENHDEGRAVTVFSRDRSRAAAVVALTLPGMRLLHEGQLEGRAIKLPVQLGRRPIEPPDEEIRAFYTRLLRAISGELITNGHWQLLEPQPAWAGNETHRHFIGHHWRLDAEWRLIVVNWSADRAQCYLPLDLPRLAGSVWRLEDLLSSDQYVRNGDQLLAPGLYLDVPGFGCHVFALLPGLAGESVA